MVVVTAMRLLLALVTASPQAPSADPGPAARERRPNLVLVTFDTTRADHVGCYGYFRDTTPTLDALAAESLVFERCYSVIPNTTASHASMMTGLHPLEHGVTSGAFREAESVQASRALATSPSLHTVAQLLHDAGWQTGGFVSGATVKRITGIAAGFAAFTEPQFHVRPGTETLDDALRWLATVPEPFFLWVHLFDAHAPPRERNQVHVDLFPGDDLLQRHLAALGIPPILAATDGLSAALDLAPVFAEYDAGLRLMDDHVRTLRDALVRRQSWDATTLVVAGDHGEGLGQHGFLLHAHVWNEQLRVPFLLRVPGRPPARISDVVSTIDVLPTALAATPGFPSDELLAQASGRNVLAEGFEEHPVFAMSNPSRGELALIGAEYKYIYRSSGSHALYRLSSDPHELHDLLATEPAVAAALERQLRTQIAAQLARHARLTAGAIAPTASAEEQSALRVALAALGYAEDGAPAPLPLPPDHQP